MAFLDEIFPQLAKEFHIISVSKYVSEIISHLRLDNINRIHS